jgi:uncharacterized protein YcaQ
VSPFAARRFQRTALRFDEPLPDCAAALAHQGFVQIDPLNICGRMHDLILRNRIVDYREGDLMRHLHGSGEAPLPAERRQAFEHHLPGSQVLAAFGVEAWPFLHAAMGQRKRSSSGWSGRLTPTERRLAPRLFDEITQRGPLAADEFDDHGPARRAVWGATSLVRNTLQKLFFHGELLIAQRVNNRRRYELPSRALPGAVLTAPKRSPEEIARWLVRLRLRQRRLALLARAEAALLADEVASVVVAGCPTLHCLRSDLPLLEAACRSDAPTDARDVRLLAPLDPLIYDRRLTRELWAFDYTWEAYTPAARRRRGHYALPVLAGLELVGHVEPKVDRAAGRLVVRSRPVKRGISTSAALDGLAQWLGVKRGRASPGSRQVRPRTRGSDTGGISRMSE